MTSTPRPHQFIQRLTSTDFSGRPGLFLDRDGVIVEEVGYLHRVEDIHFLPGVVGALTAANRARVATIVVTNQSGIARGHYGWADFLTVQTAILDYLSQAGARLDMVLACSEPPDQIRATGVGASSSWRKPQPGMFFEAAKSLEIDLALSYVVGDKLTDLIAGFRAGLCGGILTLTGHGRREAAENRRLLDSWTTTTDFAVTITDDPAEAIVEWLLTASNV